MFLHALLSCMLDFVVLCLVVSLLRLTLWSLSLHAQLASDEKRSATRSDHVREEVEAAMEAASRARLDVYLDGQTGRMRRRESREGESAGFSWSVPMARSRPASLCL